MPSRQLDNKTTRLVKSAVNQLQRAEHSTNVVSMLDALAFARNLLIEYPFLVSTSSPTTRLLHIARYAVMQKLVIVVESEVCSPGPIGEAFTEEVLPRLWHSDALGFFPNSLMNQLRSIQDILLAERSASKRAHEAAKKKDQMRILVERIEKLFPQELRELQHLATTADTFETLLSSAKKVTPTPERWNTLASLGRELSRGLDHVSETNWLRAAFVEKVSSKAILRVLERNFSSQEVAALKNALVRWPLVGLFAASTIGLLCSTDPDGKRLNMLVQQNHADESRTWDEALRGHWRLRNFARSSRLNVEHQRWHQAAGVPFPLGVPVFTTMDLEWSEWLNVVNQHADLSLTPTQREHLLQFCHDVENRLRQSTTRPPDGWTAVIDEPWFQQWGWTRIGIGSASYSWGHVRLETAEGVYAFDVGPTQTPMPNLDHDATLVAHSWLLAWIEGASQQETFVSVGLRPSRPLVAVPRRSLGSSGQPTAASLVRWRGTVTPHWPRRTSRRKSSHPITSHPVCSHIRRERPDYLAPQELQDLAAAALIDLPVGYTFVPQHWSPKLTHGDRVTLEIRWRPASAMRQWRTMVRVVQTRTLTDA